jgi:hypothetical protein
MHANQRERTWLMKRLLAVIFAATVVCGAAFAADSVNIEPKGDNQLAITVNGEYFTTYNFVKAPVKVALTKDVDETAMTLPVADNNAAGFGRVCVVIEGECVTGAFAGKEFKVDQRGAYKTKAAAHKSGTELVYEARKPFLYPVMSEGQVGITRNYPMSKDVPSEEDHPHHRGIWTSYGDINGNDFWSEGGPQDKPRPGYQKVDDVTFGKADKFAWIKDKNTWMDWDHKPVIAESREYRFYPSPAGARYFDVSVTFTAAFGDAYFKDTKEGGIVAFRIRNDLTETAKKGNLVNSEGGKGMAATWGKPADWTDYYGDVDGKGLRGIAVFDHPGNMRHPTTWHIRDYGLNGASCFGLAAFTKGKENADFTLKNGESVTFNYRVVIHSGTSEDAKLKQMYADYEKTEPIK